MTDEEIIELADKMPTGFLWWEGCGWETGILKEEAIAFARLIADKQKEIDAGICDKAAYSSATGGYVTAFMECAIWIREQK